MARRKLEIEELLTLKDAPRNDVARLLGRYGFVPVVDPQAPHARWIWKNEGNSQPAEITIGLPGHGSNPQLLPVYLRKAHDALRKVAQIENERTSITQASKDSLLQQQLPTVSVDDFKGIDAELVGSTICIRDHDYPELGITVPTKADKSIVDAALKQLQGLRIPHEDALEKLERDFGYTVIQNAKTGTQLVNTGYGIPTVTLPAFTPDDTKMLGLTSQLSEARKAGEHIQERIENILIAWEHNGWKIKTSQQTIPATDEMPEQTRRLFYLEIDKDVRTNVERRQISTALITEKMPALRNQKIAQANRVSRADTQKKLDKAKQTVTFSDTRRWFGNDDSEGKAHVMSLGTLEYLEKTFAAHVERTRDVIHRDTNIIAKKDESAHTTSYANTVTGDSIIIHDRDPDYISTRTFHDFALKTTTLRAINLLLNCAFCELGLLPEKSLVEKRQVKDKGNKSGILSTPAVIHPDLSGTLTIGDDDHDLGIISRTLSPNIQTNQPLVDAKISMLHEAQKRMEKKLIEWGFTPDPHNQQDHEIIFTFKDGSQRIALPIMDVLEDNIAEAVGTFKDAKKIMETHKALAQLEATVTPLVHAIETRFGYQAERKKPTDQARLMPPRENTIIVNLFSKAPTPISIPDAAHPGGVETFIKQAQGLLTQLEALAARKQKVIEVANGKGASAIQQEDGKFCFTAPADKGGETKIYNTYGSENVLSEPDLKSIERVLDMSEDKGAGRKR